MYCDHCGKRIKEKAKFCPFCGGDVRDENPDSTSMNVSATDDGASVLSHIGKNSLSSFIRGKQMVIIISGCIIVILVIIFANNQKLAILSTDTSGVSSLEINVIDGSSERFDIAEYDNDEITSESAFDDLNGSFIIPDSNQRVLSEEDLRGLSHWELFIARNEIYARYGRGFASESLQKYFSAQKWYAELYLPQEFDAMLSPLSALEKQNAIYILEYERSINSPYL